MAGKVVWIISRGSNSFVWLQSCLVSDKFLWICQIRAIRQLKWGVTPPLPETLSISTTTNPGNIGLNNHHTPRKCRVSEIPISPEEKTIAVHPWGADFNWNSPKIPLSSLAYNIRSLHHATRISSAYRDTDTGFYGLHYRCMEAPVRAIYVSKPGSGYVERGRSLKKQSNHGKFVVRMTLAWREQNGRWKSSSPLQNQLVAPLVNTKGLNCPLSTGHPPS